MIVSTILALAVSTPLQVASPERQKALIAKIQAGRTSGSKTIVGPPLAAVRPIPAAVSARPKSSKRAAYRRHNAEFAAEQAAAAQAQAEYERKMAPLVLEAQRQQREAATRQYEAELRYRSNQEFSDAIRGITRGRP